MGSSPPGSPFHGIYRQEYWSGLLFPSLGDLPDPGIKPLSPAWLVDSLPLRHLGSPNELGFGSKELLCGFWKTIRFLSKWKEESEVAQSCSTFCNPMDCSPPGFSIHGIFQARILEWVAVSFSRRSSWPRDRTWVSHIAGRCFPIQNVMRTSWSHYYPFLHFFFLQSSLNLLQYYFCLMFWLVGHNPRGILVPQLGVEPELPALEGRVLTTGPPGKSLSLASSCTSSSRWEDSGHMSFVCKVLNPPSADPSGPGRSDFFYEFNPVSYRRHQLELKEPKAVACRNQCPYWSCICWRSKLPCSSVPLLLCSGDAVNETALTLALMRFII